MRDNAASLRPGSGRAATGAGRAARDAERLRLKGCLIDPITRLPTLPMVLDGVRRELEGGGRMGLIYVDLASDGRYESIYGWQVYDHMLRLVAQKLKTAQGALPTPNHLSQVGLRSGELLLFVGLKEDDGARDRLDVLHGRIAGELERALEVARDLAGQPMPPLQTAAVVLGSEPTIRVERGIYLSLQQAREACRRQIERRQTGRLSELLRLLEDGDVIVRYQPIVEMTDGGVHGWEALVAPPTEVAFQSPEMLFAYAEETDRIVELERLCRREAVGRALRWAPEEGPHGIVDAGGRSSRSKLFLNCSAKAFVDPRLCGDLVAAGADAGFAPYDLVLEITERTAITEWAAFRRALDDVRAAGLQVAIDDMGSGYSSLHAVAEIEPDYLKFDISLVIDIHRSRIKRDIMEGLVHLADKIGARTVAEGLECEEEYETVRAMGIEYGQGYFFARPAEPESAGEHHFPRRTGPG